MQDKNVDFCGILNLLAALKRAGFPKTELEQVAVRIAVHRRDDSNFFLNFFAKSSSFTVVIVVCCVATRRR